MKIRFLIICFIFVHTSSAFAILYLNFQEEGSDLKVTGSGTFDVNHTNDATGSLRRLRDEFGVNEVRLILTDYSFIGNTSNAIGYTGDLPIVSAPDSSAASVSGDSFGYQTDTFFLSPIYTIIGPRDFTVGTSWNGEMTFPNRNFAMIGRSLGDSGSFEIEGQRVDWAMVIPEPSSVGLIMFSAGGLITYLRRKK